MANEHWYVVKVRSGFAAIVAQKLRKLNLETLVPRSKSIQTHKSGVRKRPSTDYVYCRFALENRQIVTGVAGVLDILGTPDPTPMDACLASETRRS